MGESGARRLLSRAVVALLAIVLVAGCAEIKSRLPSRPPARSKPPATAPAKPKPAPAKPETKPGPVAPVEVAGAFPVFTAATAEREKARLRAQLAKSGADAVAPADVGYYLDILQGRLRQSAGSRATVARRGSRIALDLSRSVRFAPGAQALGPGTREALAPLARLLGDYRQVQVTVRVSPVDAAANNDPALATRRALALAQHLNDAGVAGRRLVVVHAGAGSPRVELLLDPVVRTGAAPAPKGRR